MNNRWIDLFRSKGGLIGIGCLLIIAMTGCAFRNRENTPVTNYVLSLWPESTGKQLLVFPILFPCGVCATAIDAIIVHPISVIDDAAESTKDCLWNDLDWDNEYVTECAFLPMRAIMTPIAFSGIFLAYSCFDITAPKRVYESPSAVDETAEEASVETTPPEDTPSSNADPSEDAASSQQEIPPGSE